MKFLKISIAALAITLAIPSLHAAPDGKVREIALQKFKSLRDDLNLSADQKTKIREIIQSHKAPIKAQWANGKSARETMRMATLDHGPDSNEAKAAANTLGNVARDRSLLMAKITTEIRPILNDDQLKKIEKARLDFQSLIDSKLDSSN